MTSEELTTWLRGLATKVKATQAAYSRNKVPGCPIPFFGDVVNARVLTIGVNPSDKEFEAKRLWVEPLSVEDWQKRLLNYFTWPGVPAHPWFEAWSVCLELLRLNYAGGEAAHVDVSPRPTTPMLNEKADPAEFRRMVDQDVRLFFELLDKLPQVQLLLAAGPIPRANGRKQQLADFIRERAEKHGAEWALGKLLPRLVLPGRPEGIPVFVCPYDPDADGLYAIVRDVHRNRELLRGLVAPRMNPVPPMPAQLDWSSTIGNFMANFGMLDLHVQDFLKRLLALEELDKNESFFDRVERIKQMLGAEDCTLPNKTEFTLFFHRLDPLRDTRNHVAHGILRISMASDQKPPVQTLSLPRDLDGPDAPEARHMEFAELQAELKALNELIEDFQQLAGFKADGIIAITEGLERSGSQPPARN